jgi:hypothetical protein
MATVADITARIVAIADDITGVTADDEYPADIRVVLPFCFVEEGAATFQETDTNNVRVTQEWRLLFYVQKFNPSITNESETAYQAVRPYLTSVPSHFWNRTRLQRSDQGLTDVIRATLTGHEGIDSADRNSHLYMGVAHTLSVEYDMYKSEI